MTERNTGSDNQRRLAHERLSTGLLARWARLCASHPWRVMFGSLASIALLVVLVITVGGSLKDEFEIPGSDTQKATDLIKSEFSSEQGSVLNLVFAAPKGERLDTPERKAAVDAAVAKLKTAEFKPKDGKVGLDSVGNPFSDRTFSDNGRIAYAEAQFSDEIKTADRSSGRCGGKCRPRHGRAGGRHRRVQRRGRVTAHPAGNPGAARLPGRLHRAHDRLPHVRRDHDSDRAGDRRRRNARSSSCSSSPG